MVYLVDYNCLCCHSTPILPLLWSFSKMLIPGQRLYVKNSKLEY
jgi:hypothetical protein